MMSFNSRLREEATLLLHPQMRGGISFNSRLREEATHVALCASRRARFQLTPP